METVIDQLFALADTFPFGFAVIGNLEEGGRIIAVNEQLCQLCGYDSKEDLYTSCDRQYKNLIIAEDYHVIWQQTLEEFKKVRTRHLFYRMVSKKGKMINAENNSVLLHDEKYGWVIVMYISLANEIENKNIFDQITGLHERNYLFEWLDQQRQYNAGRFMEKHWTVIYFNILDFKVYNDAYGYDRGNQLLIAFADLLRSIFNSNLITRNYADHFVVFYEGDNALELVRKVHEEAVGLIKDVSLWVEAGLYDWHNIWDLNSLTEKALDCAWDACTTIHASRKKYYAFYTPKIANQVEMKLYIQSHISEAISRGWIQIYLQPVVRTLTGKVCGFEALSRWIDPTYGMISPGIFVPALEEKNLSYHLAEYVIDQAAALVARFEKEPGRDAVPISFNLSRRDFDMIKPFDQVERAVKKHHIKRQQLCIEITESTAMENPELIQETIRKFHEKNYAVWMDDFGSSYSSLNALKDFDFDEIKLDMVFMRNLNDKGRVIVRNCVNMAKELGVHTLCEGVETADQIEFLKSIGCEKIQGFYYSQPLPLNKLSVHLKERHIGLETVKEQTLYDAMAAVKFERNQSWFFSVVHNEEIKIIFRSEKLQQEMAEHHFLSFLNEENLDEYQSPMALRIAQAIKTARHVHQSENQSYFFDGMYYMIDATNIASYQDAYLCKTVIRNTTKESRQMILADVGPVVQSLINMYDSIYKIDYIAATMEVMGSDFKQETVGEITRFDPKQASIYLAEEERAAFASWLEEKRVMDYFSDPHHKFDSGIFHVLIGNGKRAKKFILLRSGKQTERQVLLCIRDVLEDS